MAGKLYDNAQKAKHGTSPSPSQARSHVIEACRKAGRTTERAGDVSKNLSSQPFLAGFPLFANTDAQGTRRAPPAGLPWL